MTKSVRELKSHVDIRPLPLLTFDQKSPSETNSLITALRYIGMVSEC